MERRGNIWINDKPKTSRPERKPAGQNPKTKTDVEQIMDKIDGEIKCANNSSQYSMYKEFGEDTKKREYFEGKQKALEDLKTWINENIKE